MNSEFQTVGNLIKGQKKISGIDLDARTKIVKNQILSARLEANKIIQEAENKATEILFKAEQEAENMRIEAHQEGTEKALAEYEQNLIEAQEIRERVWRETEKDLLRLSVRLAEKIIGREIEKDSKTVIDIVNVALQNARQQEKLTVRVNPQDLPMLEKENKKFASNGRVKFIDFVADPRVSAGGCLIESEVGTIDARLETQMRVIERALLSQSDGEENENY